MTKLIEGKKSPEKGFNFREMFYYWTIMLIIGYTVRAIIALSNSQEFINIL